MKYFNHHSGKQTYAGKDKCRRMRWGISKFPAGGVTGYDTGRGFLIDRFGDWLKYSQAIADLSDIESGAR